MKTPEQQIAELKIKLARVRNERDYWKRKSTRPGYESARKKRWRDSNPTKYSLEVFKNRRRAGLRRLP